MCVQSRKWFRHRRMMHFHLVISTLQSNWSLELSSFIFYSDRMFLNREYTSTWCQLRCSSSIVPFIHTLFWRAISASLHFSPGRQLLQHWNAGELKKHRAIERTTMSPLEHVKCRWRYVNFKVEARQPFLISFVAQRLLHQKPSPFPPPSIFLIPFHPGAEQQHHSNSSRNTLTQWRLPLCYKYTHRAENFHVGKWMTLRGKRGDEKWIEMNGWMVGNWTRWVDGRAAAAAACVCE